MGARCEASGEDDHRIGSRRLANRAARQISLRHLDCRFARTAYGSRRPQQDQACRAPRSSRCVGLADRVTGKAAKYVSDMGWNTVLSEQRLMRFATRVSSTSRRLSTSWARTHWRPGRRRTARQTASLNDCRSLPPRNRLAWRDPEAMEFFISGLTLAAGESGRSAASRTCRCIT